MTFHYLMCCAYIALAILCLALDERVTSIAAMLLALRHTYLMEDFP